MSILEVEPMERLEASIALTDRWLPVRRGICRTTRGIVVDSHVAERLHMLVRRIPRELVR